MNKLTQTILTMGVLLGLGACSSVSSPTAKNLQGSWELLQLAGKDVAQNRENPRQITFQNTETNAPWFHPKAGLG
jgi:hypothetical protein